MSKENVELNHRVIDAFNRRDLAAYLALSDPDDMTLSHGTIRGQGAGSGASIERPMWLVAEWRNGKMVSWRSFETEPEALQAIGPSD